MPSANLGVTSKGLHRENLLKCSKEDKSVVVGPPTPGSHTNSLKNFVMKSTYSPTEKTTREKRVLRKHALNVVKNEKPNKQNISTCPLTLK